MYIYQLYLPEVSFSNCLIVKTDGKINIFIYGDILGESSVHNVCSIWNHNFATTMPQGQEMLLRLGLSGKEKVCCLELQNTFHQSYKKIITTPISWHLEFGESTP